MFLNRYNNILYNLYFTLYNYFKITSNAIYYSKSIILVKMTIFCCGEKSARVCVKLNEKI